MGARQKLNYIHVSGSIFLAAILGVLCDSWVVFLIASAALVGGAICCGDIRFKKDNRG